MFLDLLIPIFIVGLFVITMFFKLIRPNYLLNKFKNELYNLQGLLENLNEFNNKETVNFLEFEINKSILNIEKMDFLQKYQYKLINLDILNTLIKTIKDHENLKYESESLIKLVNSILTDDGNNEEGIGRLCLSVIISFFISFLFIIITLYLSVNFGLMWALILMLLLYFTVIIFNPKKYAYLNNIFIRAMAIMLMFITIMQAGIDNKSILPYFNNFDAEFKNILMIPFAFGFIFLTELTLPKSSNTQKKKI